MSCSTRARVTRLRRTPLNGALTTRPWLSSNLSASRTGTRLTFNSCAISASTMRSPGRMAPRATAATIAFMT